MKITEVKSVIKDLYGAGERVKLSKTLRAVPLLWRKADGNVVRIVAVSVGEGASHYAEQARREGRKEIVA